MNLLRESATAALQDCTASTCQGFSKRFGERDRVLRAKCGTHGTHARGFNREHVEALSSSLKGTLFVQRDLPKFCQILFDVRFVRIAVLAWCLCTTDSIYGVVTENLAPSGNPLLGVATDLSGTDDVIVSNQGPISEVNDGVANTNLAANGYLINANGQVGMNGNGVDTYAGGISTNLFDFVGVLFAGPQYGVSSIRVQNYLANDGGWWGPTNVVAGGSPLVAGDLSSPIVQVTSNGGASWSFVGGVTSNYITSYTGAVRGTGFPDATSGPFATFNFPQQNGINGIRLIGNGAGPADGNGFIGVNEFEAIGMAQQLDLEVNVTTGMVRLTNDVHNSISLDYYQITSAGLSLDLGGWNSFENPRGNPLSFPSGD
jgi:hypothetical protein